MTMIATHRLFDGERMSGPSLLTIDADVIVNVEVLPKSMPDGVIALDSDILLAPGLIDIQVNGGGGAFLNTAPNPAAIELIARAHRRYGTTGLLPTLITDAPEVMQSLARIAADAMKIPGVLGFHLEGPFINPARKGIHPAVHIRAPDEQDLRVLEKFSACGASFVTLAPEITGDDFIRAITKMGLRAAIGHSDATSHQAQHAFSCGVTGITHLFNAMSQITPRAPGIVGAAMAGDGIFAGIICDGLHVAPDNLRTAYKAMGRDRLMLVTDAMPTAASDMTGFMIGTQKITLRDGRLTGPDGTLAGAHITMIETVKNAAAMMRCPLEDALIMASRTPARFLGLEKSHGRIAPGYRADLVAFTPDFRVTDTWIGGRREQNTG